MRFNKLFILAALLIVGSSMMSGCRKKADTIAKIIVRNNANEAVSGATVRLLAEPTVPAQSVDATVFPMETTSNSYGEAEFNFNDVYQLGQAGVAVLKIEVVKDALYGQGVIKVEQEVTTEEIVFVN